MIIIEKHVEVYGNINDPNDNITHSESFKSKRKITGKTPRAGNTKDVEIFVPLN